LPEHLLTAFLDGSGRRAHDGLAGQNVPGHNGVRADARALADVEAIRRNVEANVSTNAEWSTLRARVAEVTGSDPAPRLEAGALYVTDNGNYVLDCPCGEIGDPAALERELKLLPGVVESGLFVGRAALAFVATEEGEVEIIQP
jgi:ribose 5-phosphate isomerase